MFTVRVIPITRGVFKNELTFFSREPFPEGAVVDTNVRGRSIPGLVISSKDAREEKAGIRSAGYALKKITAGHAKPVVSPAFVDAIRDTALWHGTHEGAILAALTSSAILSAYGKLDAAKPAPTAPAAGAENAPRADLLVLQADTEERIRTYRNLARECFARGASLMLIAPTVVEAERLAAELERGIEERLFLFTSELTKRTLVAKWNRALTSAEPIIIIGTTFALSVPRTDIDTIVVERESARGYRSLARPHIDVRRAAEYFARCSGARFVLADFPLRVETRYRVDSGEMEELARAQTRLTGTAPITVLDVRPKDTAANGIKPKHAQRTFSTLTPETTHAIEEELARGGRAVVFAARRGIAPLTVCNDCGTPVTDQETGTPMTLHKTGSGNVFLSHRSGALMPAETRCGTCGSWNLVTLGIGVERVYEEIKKQFPDAPIELFTRDTAPTGKSAQKIAEHFYAARGAVLVGTERMLPYLAEPVELGVVASVDSFLSLPAWRAHEHTLSILFYLCERAELSFIVETRKPDHLVMKTLQSGNPADFYRADIEERERYGYPPFSTFVGLEWRGTKDAVETYRNAVKEGFADTDLVGPLPATAETKNLWSARAVIRVPQGAWPDLALVERLRALPPGVAVTIDPDEIA